MTDKERIEQLENAIADILLIRPNKDVDYIDCYYDIRDAAIKAASDYVLTRELRQSE